jgi:hypothetical protein
MAAWGHGFESLGSGHANPQQFSKQVAEDRDLRFRGYEFYRFSDAELTDGSARAKLLAVFVDRLAEPLR